MPKDFIKCKIKTSMKRIIPKGEFAFFILSGANIKELNSRAREAKFLFDPFLFYYNDKHIKKKNHCKSVQKYLYFRTGTLNCCVTSIFNYYCLQFSPYLGLFRPIALFPLFLFLGLLSFKVSSFDFALYTLQF